MGYASILNLYADTRILELPECWALEKIHGTSAWITYAPATDTKPPKLVFHSGEQQTAFEALFDKDRLLKIFGLMGGVHVNVHGECYGGKIQKNAWRYGDKIRFTAFDVKYDGRWLSIPEAQGIVEMLGLEFVHYVRIPTTLPHIDAERDAASEQAIRNGVTSRDGEFIRREGVVLRPITEMVDRRGNRICAKHKRKEERETKTERTVNADRVVLLKAAADIAIEWVTENRVKNAQSHFPEDKWVITNMRELIRYVHDDVYKEAGTEITPSPENSKEICKRAAILIKQNFEQTLKENH